MEPFREPRNQRLFPHQPWWGQGLDSSDNLCIPELGHYLTQYKFKSCIGLWKFEWMESGGNY